MPSAMSRSVWFWQAAKINQIHNLSIRKLTNNLEAIPHFLFWIRFVGLFCAAGSLALPGGINSAGREKYVTSQNSSGVTAVKFNTGLQDTT
jgi:hypothetical protein